MGRRIERPTAPRADAHELPTDGIRPILPRTELIDVDPPVVGDRSNRPVPTAAGVERSPAFTALSAKAFPTRTSALAGLLDPASLRRVEEWSADPAAKTQIEALIAAGEHEELRDAFSAELEFGTAGLRATMGVGPNRMNERTVAAATEALARKIVADGGAERGVVVSYDTRHNSERFAAIARAQLLAHGIRVFYFDGDRPMPEMSFAIRETGALAGVMITASHNPKAYNGFKVSWEHGGQIGKEIATSILDQMRALEPEDLIAGPPQAEAVRLQMDELYLRSIDEHVLDREPLRELKVVYDPLYGCGRELVPLALERAGVAKENLTVVDEHARAPEGGALGDFAGISSPNPSSKGVLDRAIEIAKASGADVVLATDPDADRLVAATKNAKGEWRVLPANETWSVLLEQKLSTMSSKGVLPKDGVVVRSWVTTSILDRIAAAHGLEAIEVPTGFKWIAEVMTQKNVIAGFEESDGMSMGSHTREKCALLAAVLVAEAAAQAKAKGKTLIELRDDVEAKYGRHEAKIEDLSFSGVEGREAIQRIKSVLADSPQEIFPEPGTKIEPRYDGTRARLPNGAVVTVRPSGTEPKVKVYVEQIGGALDEASVTLAQISARIRALV